VLRLEAAEYEPMNTDHTYLKNQAHKKFNEELQKKNQSLGYSYEDLIHCGT
jgi:predicted nucleotidyltransferase